MANSEEIRQVNARLPADVHNVLRLISQGRGISTGKLGERVLTAYAIKTARELDPATVIAEIEVEHQARLRIVDIVESVARLEDPNEQSQSG